MRRMIVYGAEEKFRFNYEPSGGAFTDLNFDLQSLTKDISDVHKGNCRECDAHIECEKDFEYTRLKKLDPQALDNRNRITYGFRYVGQEYHVGDCVLVYSEEAPTGNVGRIAGVPRRKKGSEQFDVVPLAMFARMTESAGPDEVRDEVGILPFSCMSC
jgi:hypothetical protein